MTGTISDQCPDTEFSNVRGRPERALSEKSPSVMEELVIECKSGAESGVTESKCHKINLY